MFRALLLSISYDLSDVKLAEALDDRASFRHSCGFSGTGATPERTVFVRYRKQLVAHDLDHSLFDAVTKQLKAKTIRVKTGTLVDATIIASASEEDNEARWVKHTGKLQFTASKPMLVPTQQRLCSGREDCDHPGQHQRRTRRAGRAVRSSGRGVGRQCLSGTSPRRRGSGQGGPLHNSSAISLCSGFFPIWCRNYSETSVDYRVLQRSSRAERRAHSNFRARLNARQTLRLGAAG